MKIALKLFFPLGVILILAGCHSIYHVRDIRSAGDGKLDVEKCEYYINGFLGTGGYRDCKVETVTVEKK